MKFRFHALVITAALLWASVSAAGQLPWPELQQSETSLYMTRFENPKITPASLLYPQKVMYYEMGVERKFLLAPVQDRPRPALRLQVISRLGSGATSTEIIDLEREAGGALWTFYSRSLKDKAGNPMREEKYYPGSPSLGYPKDVYNNIAITVVLRALVGEPKGKESFIHMWVSPQMAFQLKCTVGDTETVKTPAGTFECVKIDVRPTVSDYFGDTISRLVGPLVPKNIIWYEKGGAHRLIKMLGMMQQSPALDVPNVIMELNK